VQRQPAADTKAALANPKLLTALFSPDSVEKKRNSEAVEIGSNQLVSARITQYAPARTLPLTEVRNEVREKLVAVRAAELAKKDGAAKLQDWKQHPDAAKLASPVLLSRDQAASLPSAVVEKVMHTDTSALPAWVGVDLGNQGYTVLRINKVMERNAPAEAQAKQERMQYAQWAASAESQAYYEMLKSRFKVQVKVSKPNNIALPLAATP
ncbi:MAG: peptidyl-prolyl cis-trans isomerase, partial [Rhodoferax sp.]|nr:peptidyl-prolyl cis-trans isomerase [Rhodoferax sp.]